MDPSQPSVNLFGCEPSWLGGSRLSTNWIYQKTCYLCYVQLGAGQRRPQKLYCKACFRAICPACSVEPAQEGTKESLCKGCNKSRNSPQRGEDEGKWGVRMKPGWNRRFQFEGMRRYSEVSDEEEVEPGEQRANATVDDALQSAKFVLEDLKSQQNSAPPSGLPPQSSALLARIHSQLTEYDTERVDLRRQVVFYAEELDRRETSIEEMSERMQKLTKSNSTLEQRVASLEQALAQLSEKSSEISSTQEAKVESCVHCLIF